MTEDLFPEFEASRKADWIAQATRDLKGKDFEQSLGSTLWGKIKLSPFYTSEDLNGPAVQHRFHPQNEIPGLPPRVWTNLISVLPGDSNQQVIQALENGAEGLVLHLHGVEDLSELLKGVLPQYIPIFIFPLGNPVLALRSFFEWADSTGTSPDLISGGLLWTPSDLVFDRDQPFGLGVEILSELLEMAEPYPAFKAFSVKTSRYSESGANPLEALVFGLGELIESLDRLFIDPKQVFSKVFFEASVGESHFGEIARMKALRKVACEMAGLYGLEIKEQEVLIFSQTSGWSKSLLDVNTNLVRQTYEAMAAVLGGANFLWVRPLQEENSSEMERRIARNVSTILREESHLDKVMDPSAGSYYLENLTSEMQRIIQAELQQLESRGGWEKSLTNGAIHSLVRKNREVIQIQVLENQTPKIGASKYPAPPSLQKNLELVPFEEKMHELKPTRATYLVELQTLTQS
ncbi:methylmalonyl-CoA mutase family protein [Algoriphagus sp. AK58]|uniref:methylmalonyl-CoA mutase family protein n=1 Tax=Algoriphagus sp. AK58 TaxID=1406877 RepID=UPI00164EE96A|nr:methylmalonyl-CoA mutase family protein [Algoriphagus sp. AK58]MBC6366957.1 hypothetical protein [Algoriphagus sp. AK58]